VYFAGRLIKQNTDAVLASADNNFVAVDGMGSVVYAAPTSEGALQVNTSYLPYGEELSATTNDVIKFATYTRDSSTGLDYADQRFYTSQFGRFMSADRFVQTSKANDSGSWNKYAYTRGDPVNRTDVHGTCDEEDGYTGCDPLGGGGTMPRPGTPCTDDRPGPHADCAGSAGGGSPDVSKSYSETINCNETSAQLLTKLESNFGSFANYSGTFGPGGAPAAAAQIQFSGNVSLGSTINITDVNTIFLPFLPTQTQTVAVTVSAISSSGFTFTTLPGHVLFPATISFSATTGANGQLTFAVNVNGNFANSTSQALYNVGGSNLENKIWNNLLANVQTDCSK
jgi:RHS repeat-associated protein